MVKSCLFLIIFLLISCHALYAQSVHVDASVNQNLGSANQPIKGTITITHDSKEKIDASSFQIGIKPLEAKLIQSVPMSAGQSSMVVSIYHFELPAKDEGLYILDPISVKVGTKRYQSTAASYTISSTPKQVKTPVSSSSPSSQPSSNVTSKKVESEPESPLIFSLESLVKGPTPLYPGQRAHFIYRIRYNRSIDLTNSHFPLLYMKDFRKIGDAQIKDYEEGGVTVQDIEQEVEAIKPGSFQYETSSISGYAYKMDSLEKKTYIDELLSATAPALEIEVAQFPLHNQPASFNGAIANTLNAQVKMLTPNHIQLGDSINLELTLTGPTNLTEVNLPNLNCQPGFSGFFILNDLPPLAQFNKKQKKFTINLRAISNFVKAIPSIELSAFNPETVDYIIWRSPEIPLDIAKANRLDEPQTNFSPLQPVQPLGIDINTVIKNSDVTLPALTDFQPILIEFQDLKFSWLQTPFVLFTIPVGFFYLFWIWKKRRLLTSQQVPQKMSEKFFRAAFNLETPSSQIPGLLRQALIWYLREQENFSETDGLNASKFHRISAFLDKLDDFQYGYPNQQNIDSLREEAKHLLTA